MKYLSVLFFCSVFFVFMAISCQSSSSDSANKDEIPSEPAKIDSSILADLAKILSKCQKVEYVLYSYGITFETQSTNEMQRFFNFIQLEKADTQKCPADYDGGVVFKDIEGDIKMAMELNIVPECKQVVFTLNGETYHQVFSDEGIDLFKEIIKMRQGG